MKIKSKTTGEIGESSDFNTLSMSEIFVYFDDWMDTDFPSNYLFWLESEQKWVEFKHPKILPNNYNTRFQEATCLKDIERGYVD